MSPTCKGFELVLDLIYNYNCGFSLSSFNLSSSSHSQHKCLRNKEKKRQGKKRGINNIMWYLCVFYHRLLDYRKPEVESLAHLFGAFKDNQNENENNHFCSLQWKLPLHHHQDSPFHFVNLPSEHIARNIANRSAYFFFLLDQMSFLLCYY